MTPSILPAVLPPWVEARDVSSSMRWTSHNPDGIAMRALHVNFRRVHAADTIADSSSAGYSPSAVGSNVMSRVCLAIIKFSSVLMI
jgi:hypothetical protein